MSAGPPFEIQTPHGTVRAGSRADVDGSAAFAGAFADHRQDCRYYRIVEDTILQHFVYRYFMIESAGGDRAVQPYFLVDQDILDGAGKTLRRLAGVVRRAFPRFLFMRSLMVGCAAGEGHLDGDPANGKAAWVADCLHASLKRHARKARASLIVLKEFPAAYRAAMTSLASNGFTRIPSFPMTRLRLDFPDFETYLTTVLSKNARKSVRKNLRDAEAGGRIDVEVLTDVAPVIDEVYPLYLQVFARAKMKFEKLTKEYLCRLGRDMPDRARFFVWRAEGRAVAFAVTMVSGGALYDLYLGMEYPLALERHLYYYTFRDVINYALAQGLKLYCSTPLGYDPKLRLGCDLMPLDLYVRHRNPVANFFMRRILPYLEPTRNDKVLREFSNYHELWDDDGRR